MLRNPKGASAGGPTTVVHRRLFAFAVVLCIGFLTSSAFPQDARRHRESSVEAPVLQWIQIDGDLSDWPAAMPRHAISKRLAIGQLGTGGLDDADTATSPDLS